MQCCWVGIDQYIHFTRILPCSMSLPCSTLHYNDVIMGTMMSQITSLTIVYSIDYAGTGQRKHQSSASLAFVRGIHRWPVNSPYFLCYTEILSASLLWLVTDTIVVRTNDIYEETNFDFMSWELTTILWCVCFCGRLIKSLSATSCDFVLHGDIITLLPKELRQDRVPRIIDKTYPGKTRWYIWSWCCFGGDHCLSDFSSFAFFIYFSTITTSPEYTDYWMCLCVMTTSKSLYADFLGNKIYF